MTWVLNSDHIPQPSKILSFSFKKPGSIQRPHTVTCMQQVKEVFEITRPNIHFVTRRILWFQYYSNELNIHALSQKGHRTDCKITGGKKLYICP